MRNLKISSKRIRTAVLSAVAVAVLVCGSARAADSDEPITVAVLSFGSSKQLEPGFGANVAALVNARLSAQPELWMVERAELDTLLSEQELGLSGNVAPETAAQVGKLTGAKVLISGSAFVAGNETIMVAKVISTETSRVFGEMVKGGKNPVVSELATELAKKIAATISENIDKLRVKIVPTPDRIAAIKEALPPGKRPTVSVRIPERHFGAPVNDPAAETEIIHWLTACGFEVFDSKSDRTPDYRIEGEAFSALGLRRGNLVSCRARVELKVIETASSKIVYSTARTGIAVDIAEQTAAKTALSETASRVAETLVPKLME